MFERFSERARTVLSLANCEARRRGHEMIHPEHVFLGFLKEGSGVGAHALKNLGVDLAVVCRSTEELIPAGELADMPDPVPPAPAAKQVIERAVEEARGFNHNYVGTEHLLLALVRDEGEIIPKVLKQAAVSPEMVRKQIISMHEYWSTPEPLIRLPAKRLCERCGNDLTGNVSGVCPECGTKVVQP